MQLGFEKYRYFEGLKLETFHWLCFLQIRIARSKDYWYPGQRTKSRRDHLMPLLAPLCKDVNPISSNEHTFAAHSEKEYVAIHYPQDGLCQGAHLVELEIHCRMKSAWTRWINLLSDCRWNKIPATTRLLSCPDTWWKCSLLGCLTHCFDSLTAIPLFDVPNWGPFWRASFC